VTSSGRQFVDFRHSSMGTLSRKTRRGLSRSSRPTQDRSAQNDLSLAFHHCRLAIEYEVRGPSISLRTGNIRGCHRG